MNSPVECEAMGKWWTWWSHQHAGHRQIGNQKLWNQEWNQLCAPRVDAICSVQNRRLGYDWMVYNPLLKKTSARFQDQFNFLSRNLFHAAGGSFVQRMSQHCGNLNPLQLYVCSPHTEMATQSQCLFQGDIGFPEHYWAPNFENLPPMAKGWLILRLLMHSPCRILSWEQLSGLAN